ncbi:MAG: GTP cyclohydrolase I [Pseudomonadota bacterium]
MAGAPLDPEEALRVVLAGVGFDQDPETAATPAAFLELLRGLDPRRPAPAVTLLDARSSDPVLLRGLPFHSMCAHHLVPFLGTACVGFRPAGRLIGLGSVARLLHHHALRPQLQERLGASLAQDLLARLGARAVFVHLEARHLCMEMRGARTPAQVETLAWRGEDDPELRAMLGEVHLGGEAS